MSKLQTKNNNIVDFPGLAGKEKMINRIVENQHNIIAIAISYTDKEGNTSTCYSSDLDHQATIYGIEILKNRLLNGC